MKTLKVIILASTLFLLACNEKGKIYENANIKTKSSDKKENSKSEYNLRNKVSKTHIHEVIYDTLVFEKEMKGKLLEEKFNSAKDKLKLYNEFVSPSGINKLKVIKKERSKTEIRYLGKLIDLRTKNSYHIITNFTIIGIGEMLSPRGRSEVAFLSEDKNQIIIYNLAMPEYLPKVIKKNILFFQNENRKIGISISGGLPPELCIPEIGCN